MGEVVFTNGFFLFNSSSSLHKAGALTPAYHYSLADERLSVTIKISSA
ncbi:hypothetical protein CKO_03261 [Citrobacter koseri ATCC BAA-895]|uniref:Uncharacterized protein n=1 Tax=Citrobacter koseri (strain ATCC BAA-895 / CDC 4225-83 / SGSC4696) TaxID=290338 RepID=A8ALI2_CITK8|nr:hypothetical protein CKO_03261 [Citrobacter koseri ATCC BAA-895]